MAGISLNTIKYTGYRVQTPGSRLRDAPLSLQLGDHIYWTDFAKRTLERAAKQSARQRMTVETMLDQVEDLKAVSASKQRAARAPPCGDDNGGCSHLCLPRPGDVQCACPDKPSGAPCVPRKLQGPGPGRGQGRQGRQGSKAPFRPFGPPDDSADRSVGSVSLALMARSLRTEGDAREIERRER